MDEHDGDPAGGELAAAIRAREALEPRAARALPRPHRPSEPRRSTRSSRSTSTGARTAADAADAALARGDAVGPLHGLPVTIKDAIETEGIRSTGGARRAHRSRARRTTRPRSRGSRPRARSCSARRTLPRWSGDVADLQRHLRRHATTRGTSTTPPAARRAVRRPRSPPGFTSFELGTDIGGSVRIPSHCCGVFGLKPSFGVVPAARLPRPRRRRHDRRRHQRVRSDRAQRRRPRPPARRARRHPSRSSRPRGASTCRRATARSLDEFRIGVWLDDPASSVDAEYRAMLRRHGRRARRRRARRSTTPIRRSTSPNSAGLFFRMIVAAMSPSLPDERRRGDGRFASRVVARRSRSGPRSEACGRSGSSSHDLLAAAR